MTTTGSWGEGWCRGHLGRGECYSKYSIFNLLINGLKVKERYLLPRRMSVRVSGASQSSSVLQGRLLTLFPPNRLTRPQTAGSRYPALMSGKPCCAEPARNASVV